MAEYKIKVVTEGAKQAADDLGKIPEALKKTDEAARKTGEQTTKLDGVIKRAAQGFNKLGNESQLLGGFIDALKNPFSAVAAVVIFGITKFREYTEALKEIVSNTDHAAKRIKVSAESYSDAAVAVGAMTAAMKDLRDFTKNVTDNLDKNIEKLEEQFAATERLLDAEAELAKVKLDRDEADPVKRAKAKAAIDDTLAGTKLGLAGKKGQQASLVEKQRLQERQLQIDAVAGVPSRESLVANVSAFESDRANLEEAENARRQAFGKAELISRFVREHNSPDFFKLFGPSDIKTLEGMGLISGLSGSLKEGVLGGAMKPNLELANQMLPGAEADLAASRERKARAQSAFNYSRGSLPAGIAQLSDIDPFLNNAETQAAGVANEAYQREEGLARRRDSLLRGQQGDVAAGRFNTQITAVKGQIGVEQAVREALAEQAKAFADALRQNAREMQNTNRAIAIQSQNAGR